MVCDCRSQHPRFSQFQGFLWILAICVPAPSCAGPFPLRPAGRMRPIIDPVQETYHTDWLELETTRIFVRSLFFLPHKCKPGTRLSLDGDCVVTSVGDSTVSHSRTALELAVRYAKRQQSQSNPTRRFKARRKYPLQELEPEVTATTSMNASYVEATVAVESDSPSSRGSYKHSNPRRKRRFATYRMPSI